MKTGTDLLYLSQCISTAGQAVVYRYFDDTHKQALGIKKSLIVDCNGKLYFTMNTQFEEKFSSDVFPVEFFVYKKGTPFYISGKGNAVRLRDRSDSNVCVKMEDLENVYHPRSQATQLLWQLQTLPRQIHLHALAKPALSITEPFMQRS